MSSYKTCIYDCTYDGQVSILSDNINKVYKGYDIANFADNVPFPWIKPGPTTNGENVTIGLYIEGHDHSTTPLSQAASLAMQMGYFSATSGKDTLNNIYTGRGECAMCVLQNIKDTTNNQSSVPI